MTTRRTPSPQFDDLSTLSLTQGVVMVCSILLSRLLHPRKYALAEKKRALRGH